MGKHNRNTSRLLAGILAIACIFACAGKKSEFAPDPADYNRSESGTIAVSGLKVGAAVADITPSKNEWMAGLRIFRKSRGVHDRLMAHVIVIKSADSTIRLVSLDLLGMMAHDIAAFRDEMWNPDTDPPPIIACTHTHSGPDMLGFWGGTSKQYTQYLNEQVKSAVRQAEENAVDAAVYAGMGRLPDGTVKNIRQTDLLDLEVGVLQFRNKLNGENIATLINFAAHPEVLWSDNRLFSADYLQYIYRDIESAGGGVPVFFNGAMGAMVTPDVSSLPMGDFIHTFDEAMRIAGLMMVGIDGAIENSTEIAFSEIKWRNDTYTVPAGYPLFDIIKKLGFWTRTIVDGDLFVTETSFIQMGPVKIITFPGELHPGLGMDVKAAAGTQYTFIISLANDELGYLLPEKEYDNPIYSYEATVSPGPEATGIILQKALEMVK